MTHIDEKTTDYVGKMNTKKFTILHSNDMHGDFLAELKAGETKLIGGLALLSGYINKVRREEENVLYVISGDIARADTGEPALEGCGQGEDARRYLLRLHLRRRDLGS